MSYKDHWASSKDYGDYFYDMAVGDLPEMECSKSLCNILKGFYKPGMSILDVACGGGHYLRSIMNHLDSDVNYTGADVTPYYIDKANEAFGDKATFQVGDIYDLKFEDNNFDITMANNVLLHLKPNPIKAIEELLRVSKEFVVIRTVFGERNYVIREVRPEMEDGKEVYFKADEPTKDSNFFNLYTEQYFLDVLNSLSFDFTYEIKKDDDFGNFDTREHTTNTGTKVINGSQISGNIILDWRFLIIRKN